MEFGNLDVLNLGSSLDFNAWSFIFSKQDFYNLVDVYLDAVFFPKCLEDYQTFQQEGWHYELNNPSEDISYKGHSFCCRLFWSVLYLWDEFQASCLLYPSDS